MITQGETFFATGYVEEVATRYAKDESPFSEIQVWKGAKRILTFYMSPDERNRCIYDSTHLSDDLKKWVDGALESYNKTGREVHVTATAPSCIEY